MECKKSIDVIIPTYRPGKELDGVLELLSGQSVRPGKIILINTGEAPWADRIREKYPITEIHFVSEKEFDHGGTRHLATTFSKADYLMFMTQDAMPADGDLIKNLVESFSWDDRIRAAYARQLPNDTCREIEKYTRSFNYPEKSRIKSLEDMDTLGIKTFFCSNVCSMYDRKTYEELGGFTRRTIFNEDMIYAGGLIKKGYRIAYVAEAKVIHSHNYGAVEQFHRNFDLAVSQKSHPEVFGGIRSEKEGIRLVLGTAKHCIRIGKPWLLFPLVTTSAGKILGFKLGQKYDKLSEKEIMRCTMNPSYWKRTENGAGSHE